MGQALALLHSAEALVFIAAAPVRSHHPLVVPGDDFLHFLVSMPGAHLVDGGLVGVKGHQVGVVSTYLPARVIGVDHRGLPHYGPQFLVLLTHPASGLAQGAWVMAPWVSSSPVSRARTRGTLRTGTPTW